MTSSETGTGTFAKRSLAIRQKALGPDHPHVARILYWWARRYTYGSVEVEPLLTRALGILDKTRGENSLTVFVLKFLDDFYRSRGRYAEAESVLKRALAIAEKYTPKDATVPATLGNLADLYRQTGRTSDALPLAQRALAMRSLHRRRLTLVLRSIRFSTCGAVCLCRRARSGSWCGGGRLTRPSGRCSAAAAT